MAVVPNVLVVGSYNRRAAIKRAATARCVCPRPDFLIRTLPGCISDDARDRHPQPITERAFLQEHLTEIGLLAREYPTRGIGQRRREHDKGCRALPSPWPCTTDMPCSISAAASIELGTAATRQPLSPAD